LKVVLNSGHYGSEAEYCGAGHHRNFFHFMLHMHAVNCFI